MRAGGRWRFLLCFAVVVVVVDSVVWLRGGRSPAEMIGHFPSHGAVDVVASTAVAVTLDRPLEPSVEQLDFQLHDADRNRVEADLMVSRDTASATLRPRSALAPGDYTATVALPGADAAESWTFHVPRTRELTDGGGGPILVALSEADPVDDFYPEVLRAEGFTSFTTVDVGELDSEVLAGHEVLLLAGAPDSRTAGQVARWVRAGGRLVVVRPRGTLADLAGLGDPVRVRQGAWMEVAVDAWRTTPLRLRGSVDVRAGADGQQVLARLEGASGGGPAVTLRKVGRGQVAAFGFDLAASVVTTRQGNPNWAGQERDGIPPLRPGELFLGDADDDVPGQFLDLNRVAVPQADELMRLFSYVVGRLTSPTMPLPRLWYFPDDLRAVLVMTADDHRTAAGTEKFFAGLRDREPEGCDPAAWTCPRATSWLYPGSGLAPETAERFVEEGFDLGVHPTNGCRNWTPTTLDRAFGSALGTWRREHPDLPVQVGNRFHCIVWSDYATMPVVARSWGARVDMNYYYWPRKWVRGRAGFMTGSGVPMRFHHPERGLVDVLQQPTHLVDEVFHDHLDAVDALLASAQGGEGYVGAFGTHFDFTNRFAEDLANLAVERGVPMVSARQLLEWVDGRSATRFEDLTRDGREVEFTVAGDPEFEGRLRGMLPMRGLGGRLVELSRDGVPVATTVRSYKGVEYAFFGAVPGRFRARY